MSKRKPEGTQVDTINRYSPFVQQSFDLARLDSFVTGLGVDFIHYKAMPSPIGQKERGEYRRSDGVDTITSNGMLYHCAGRFTATLSDNRRSQKRGEVSLLDPSQCYLVLPRFYNKNAVADGDRIYMAPGDRVYIADPNADVLVSNYQKVTYEIGDNVTMFPAVKIEQPIIDSRGIEYQENQDFMVTDCGNIRWLPTGRNPGIDPETGKGRVYSIRYLYKAYFYITDLPKEIRITNVTTGDVRSPERMPMHALVVREFIFHQINRGGQTNEQKTKTPARQVAEPTESIKESPVVQVDMTAIEDDGEQS